jgi:hypothetical protein
MVRTRLGHLVIGIVLALLILSPYMIAVPNNVNQRILEKHESFAEVPVIDNPPDLLFENGSKGETITWNASDPNPKNYTIYRNDEEIESDEWDGEEITVNLNHLYSENLTHTLPVSFIYRCQVFNMDNESVSDEVNVTVIADVVAPIISQVQFDEELVNVTVGVIANFSYEVGSFGHEVEWNITETNPHWYNITRISNETTSNDTIIESSEWTGENISINVDNLNSTRWYAYTLWVNDTLGYNSSSTVNITIYPDLTPPTISSPDDIIYEYGSYGPALDHDIVWEAYDSNPASYEIEVIIHYNDTSYGNLTNDQFHGPGNVTLDPWNFTEPEGQDITYDVTFFYVGNYTFTITLFDKIGLNTTDSLNVTIYRDERAPVVNATNDFNYEEGYTGNYLNWSAEESNPRFYNLTLNGDVVMNGTWRGENLSIIADGLDVGQHVYNMTLTDFFNRSISLVTRVTVDPDSHFPLIHQIRILQSYSTEITNNITLTVYCWDLNRIRNITVTWYTEENETENTLDMNPDQNDFYIAQLGEFDHGAIIYYQISAIDNSSVNNEEITELHSFEVTRLEPEDTPALLWGGLLILGLLSTLVILILYFRTKTK